MLALKANEGQANLKRCLSYDQALPLDLLTGWEESKLLSTVGKTKYFEGYKL
jgi:hypothetical protein